MKPSDNILSLLPKNAGMHNSIFRGEDITELFYNGTLSKQIANQTFDDIFIGDYIIGKVSKRKYLVADINYRLHTGYTECITPHVLMIPEKTMGTEQMNEFNTTIGAYIGSKMYAEHIDKYRNVIRNDFGKEHVLKHQNFFQSEVTRGYPSSGGFYDSDIDLMSETMTYGSHIFSPGTHNQGGNDVVIPYSYTIDKSQLALFRLRPDLIIALNDEGNKQWYWLRDIVSNTSFALVTSAGYAGYHGSVNSYGVRPAFLIY